MTIRRAVGGDWYVLVNDAGVPIAQGTQRMCQLVAAGKPLYLHQGNLFDA